MTGSAGDVSLFPKCNARGISVTCENWQLAPCESSTRASFRERRPVCLAGSRSRGMPRTSTRADNAGRSKWMGRHVDSGSAGSHPLRQPSGSHFLGWIPYRWSLLSPRRSRRVRRGCIALVEEPACTWRQEATTQNRLRTSLPCSKLHAHAWLPMLLLKNNPCSWLRGFDSSWSHDFYSPLGKASTASPAASDWLSCLQDNSSTGLIFNADEAEDVVERMANRRPLHLMRRTFNAIAYYDEASEATDGSFER